ncbi:MAG: hypothetical protein ACOZBL_03665 [Patescibacteria group bacterium]
MKTNLAISQFKDQDQDTILPNSLFEGIHWSTQVFIAKLIHQVNDIGSSHLP